MPPIHFYYQNKIYIKLVLLCQSFTKYYTIKIQVVQLKYIQNNLSFLRKV